MFDSRDRRSWYLLSPHELGLDTKLNLEPLNYLVLVVIHLSIQFAFVLDPYSYTMLMYT